MLKHAIGWTVLAIAFGSAILSASRTDAEITPPIDETACRFDALADIPGDPGLAVRAAPHDDAPVLAQLPVIARFQVVGFKDGWFQIEGAASPDGTTLYAGRGWVEGKGITTNLYRDTLKKAPDNAALDIAYLNGTDTDGISGTPYNIRINRVLACTGPWFEVELWWPGVKTVFGKPASADGMVRGWTDKSCADRSEACRVSQFDYPWSPLPAGVTECNFGALSNDLDPAGLNVHEAPDRNAPIVGRVQPPSTIGGDTRVLADVHVIGFKKGWFLVALGPYDPADLPPHGPKPYTGRGWVAGNMLTTELLRNVLKQEPSEKSADVIDLEVDNDRGNVSNPQTVKMRRILACSGDWVHVEIALQKGMKPLLKSDAPPGAVRGWSNGTCTGQLTTCDFDQSQPWSPDAPLPPE